MPETLPTSRLVPRPLQAVFFDLDGTLLDTAPDIGSALNQLRREEKLEAIPLEKIRPHVSLGARGIIRYSFGEFLEEKEQQRLCERLVSLYAEKLCFETHLFPHVPDVLGEIRATGLRWGIVTNKVAALAMPLLDYFPCLKSADCLVFGDTVKQKKPHPESLFCAAKEVGADILRSVYVGDGKRDVEAAKSSGCFSVAVAYGYEAELSPPEKWGADLVLPCLSELSEALSKFGELPEN